MKFLPGIGIIWIVKTGSNTMKLNTKIEEVIEEIAAAQKKKVLECGRSFVPTLTQEDVLQPIDYPELENNAHFRYEEGVLEGIQTVHTALLALFKELQRER